MTKFAFSITDLFILFLNTLLYMKNLKTSPQIKMIYIV